jgi:hypothetical protein
MDFPRGLIEVNSYTNRWGPFSFDFSVALPTGDAIQAATVKSALGGSDTTTNLIEPGTTSIVGSAVSVRLQYPGPTLTGAHTLLFELTLASGAQHRFLFGHVLVT